MQKFPNTATVTASEAASRVSELLGTVRHRGMRIVITSHGKPAAVLVPFADFERMAAEQPAAPAGATV